MLTIGIDPILFYIGSLSIRWYGIFVVLAVLVIILWVRRAGSRAGLTWGFILTGALWALPFGIVVSRLLHVLDNLGYYTSNPGQIIGLEGMTIFGAILGGVLGLWIYTRLHRVPFSPLADLIAPGIILAQAVGRIGCIINGCCYGKPTSLPWGFIYTSPNSLAPKNIPIHPTQAYELLWDLAVFAILFLVFRGHLRPKGSLFALYLALYSIGTFGVRFLRGDTVPVFDGIMEGQLIALMVLAITIPFLVFKTRWVSARIEPDVDLLRPAQGNGTDQG